MELFIFQLANFFATTGLFFSLLILVYSFIMMLVIKSNEGVVYSYNYFTFFAITTWLLPSSILLAILALYLREKEDDIWVNLKIEMTLFFISIVILSINFLIAFIIS
ncbi:MAG: hypothetical protein ACJAWV_003165 [Flammeovirgaceae bacterium]|jgi:hypothetical protein